MLRHVFSSDDLSNTSLSQDRDLATAPTVEWRHIPRMGRREEALIPGATSWVNWQSHPWVTGEPGHSASAGGEPVIRGASDACP